MQSSHAPTTQSSETPRAQREARLSPWGWIALGSAVGMALGAFGPWARALGASVSGLDGNNDGWFVVAFAVVAALSVVLYESGSGSGWAGIAIVFGLSGAGVAWYDRSKVDELTSGEFDLVQVGWGLNLALVASVAVIIASVFLAASKSSNRRG